MPLPASTIPPPPTTGLKVKGCYAAATLDCKPPLTSEHPLSRGILKVLSGGWKTIGVSGHPWQADQTRVDSIGISAAAKKVLCKRHNNALSPLDDVGARFVDAYSDGMIHLNSGASGEFRCLFNGFDIERWMLKVLCAVHYDMPVPGSVILEPWRVSKSWLPILFGKARFPRGAGLYKTARPTRKPLGETSIYVQPIYGRLWPTTEGMLPLIIPEGLKILLGVKITVLNMELQLLMRRPANMEGLAYRPHLIRFDNHKTACSTNLHFGWDESPPTFEERLTSPVEHEFSTNAAQRRATLKALRKG